MMLVMATVGVPPEGIAIILGVDRILDMSRTTLNVCGDISASVYVDRVDREIEGIEPAAPLFVGSPRRAVTGESDST
jgi:DAACS family dicarboxylate/amino acid:cation (Na+ or H+) symporter